MIRPLRAGEIITNGPLTTNFCGIVCRMPALHDVRVLNPLNDQATLAFEAVISTAEYRSAVPNTALQHLDAPKGRIKIVCPPAREEVIQGRRVRLGFPHRVSGSQVVRT